MGRHVANRQNWRRTKRQAPRHRAQDKTLESWAAQEDIAETLKTLKEIAAAISASNKTHAAANCLPNWQRAHTLEDVALREACSAFAFDAWLAKWTTRDRARRRVAPQKRGRHCQHRDRTKVTMKHAKRTHGKRQRLRGRIQTQSRAAETASVAAPRLLATTLDLCARPRDGQEWAVGNEHERNADAQAQGDPSMGPGEGKEGLATAD
ncbi:hypothetical protein ERJ75_001772400 [Trypanosoma vivax]|nr:hypothetical protein ERJ75_001772400 [Trypanosoma vivax]